MKQSENSGICLNKFPLESLLIFFPFFFFFFFFWGGGGG